MTGSEWIDLALGVKISGLRPRHLVNLIRSGDVIGYDGRRTGARRARWLVHRDSLVTFINERRRAAKDLSPGVPGAPEGTSA